MKTIKLLFLSILTSAFIVSCSDDDTPEVVNEEEVITTMTVTLIPQGGGDIVTLKTQDLDGDGPTQPVVTVSGPIALNTTYDGSVEFLNELEDPAEDITEEVLEEDDEHQVFYTLSNDVGTVSYTDSDGDGNPIGVRFEYVSGSSATTGGFVVTLRHEPNKSAPGVSDGIINNAGGETDIEQAWQVTLQ
jgi:hypothetical protein